jgi:hypothetical protein
MLFPPDMVNLTVRVATQIPGVVPVPLVETHVPLPIGVLLSINCTVPVGPSWPRAAEDTVAVSVMFVLIGMLLALAVTFVFVVAVPPETVTVVAVEGPEPV